MGIDSHEWNRAAFFTTTTAHRSINGTDKECFMFYDEFLERHHHSDALFRSVDLQVMSLTLFHLSYIAIRCAVMNGTKEYDPGGI